MGRRDHFRLGTGAGFSADRLDPAVDLVAKGRLDAIVFECIGERTLAFGHRDRMADPEAGYNPLLERRLRRILPLCAAHGTRLITNMGVANPRGAAAKTAQVARALGLRGLRIAALEGDDVGVLIGEDTPLPDAGLTVGEVGRPMVGANAYLGADAILPALEADADVVITGARRRPQPVPRAAAPRLRLGGGRLADPRRRHAGRAPHGVRRADHRRLLRRPRLQGRAEPRLRRLSDRRGRRGRQRRDHQARGCRRPGQRAHGEGAAALRGARPRRLRHPGRGRRLQPRGHRRGRRDRVAVGGARAGGHGRRSSR